MGILSDITARASSPKPGTLTYNLLTKAAGGHVRIYRATGGRILGRAENAPMLLLDHVGRKSGVKRTTPLVYIRDGEDVLLVASMGGSPKHPAWFLNLREMDETQIQIGSRRERVRPQVLTSAEKAAVWDRVVQTWPAYQAYQDRTDREIPVIRLRPA
jgi:F420H(2)-dependent quinone reductase